MNRKLLLLPFAALALGACTLTVQSDSAPAQTTTTVSTGLSLRLGVRVADIITRFEPTRGTGANYAPGENIQFRITVTRPGYVTLAIFNPDGDVYDERLRNIPVEAGTNVIPREVRLTAAAPRGRSYVRAYFTPAPGTVSFSGRYTRESWDARTRVYLGSYPETARDVADTYLDVF